MGWFVQQQWWATLTLAGVLLLAGVVWARTVPKRRRVVWWIFVVPALVTSLIFVWIRSYWVELGVGLLLGGVALVLWAALIGYRLPKPNDSIKVWGQE